MDIHSVWTNGLQMQDLVVSILGICGLLLHCSTVYLCFLNVLLCLCFVLTRLVMLCEHAGTHEEDFVSFMKVY